MRGRFRCRQLLRDSIGWTTKAPDGVKRRKKNIDASTVRLETFDFWTEYGDGIINAPPFQIGNSRLDIV